MTEQHPGAPRPHDETSPPAAQPAATATAPPPPPPYAGPYAGPYGEPPAAPRKLRLRDRVGRVPRAAWLSAAAVVVIVGVGLGGFFLGRATAPEGGGRPFDNGQRPDFPGGPGTGQMPGMPGQQGAPSTDDNTDDGTGSSTEGSADATSWYVVPQAS